MKGTCILLILVLAACILFMPVSAQQDAVDTTKAVIVTMHYKDGTVTPVGSRVVYGYPPDNIANNDMLADIVAKDGSIIGSYGIEDPRILYYEEGAVLKDDVEFVVILPFDTGAAQVDLFDGPTGQKLASADISGTVSQFCSDHADDPDCAGPGNMMFVYVVAVIVIIILGAGLFLLMKQKKGGA